MKFAAIKSSGEWYYPFAEHKRFKFWAYDRLMRHRSLSQSKVYLNQNPNDKNLTIGQLKSMIGTNDSEELIKRMSSYCSNVTGSDSYWYKRRSELEATFEQKRIATCFFTFSFADTHWHDLHRLMPKFDKNGRYANVLKNTHLVDLYFGNWLEKFTFDDILKSEWTWHR